MWLVFLSSRKKLRNKAIEFKDRLTEGRRLQDALLVSGRRFRPVRMTSLATILGMLLLAIGLGAELLQPLAIAVIVIGGLTISLLRSLVVTPVIFAILSIRSN